MRSASTILAFDRVTKRFGGITALNEVSFEVPRGSILGLIGPNGAGKTTVFNVMTGAFRPSSGRIFFDGNPVVAGEPAHAIAKRGVARTFQNIRLFRSMTVREHVLAGQRPAGWSAALLPVAWGDPQGRERAEEILRFVGLAEVGERLAATLSYGQQRKVEIARALAASPRLLLLDEPVAGMNHDEAQELRELLLRLKADGLTILLIEHDMPFVMNLCDELVVLDFGAVIASGSPAEVRRNPVVLEAYLGKEAHA